MRKNLHEKDLRALCHATHEIEVLTWALPTLTFIPVVHGGDLDSTGSVTLWLRAQLPSAGKTLGKIITANTELALAA